MNPRLPTRTVLALLAAAALGSAEPVTPPAVASVTISTAAPRPVNRMILGQNVLGYPAVNQPKNPYIELFSMKGSGLWDPQAKAPVEAMLGMLRTAGATTLRWPGGCEAHEFNWKQTVGPREGRPRQAFGLPEFLDACKRLGAEPMITMADYWGEPADFADLAEYLNAPAGSNPNGGTAWADVRAADGHPEPWKVRWFEVGNESHHGAHNDVERNGRPYPPMLSPYDYCQRLRQVAVAMRAVDPGVKIGAVLGYDIDPGVVGGWSEDVIRGCAGHADFHIYHVYSGDFNKDAPEGPREVFLHGMATGRQVAAELAAIRERVRALVGKDVPLMMSEFNAGYAQDKPMPYRFTMGAAVQVADLLQVMIQGDLGVESAHYWQFSNEYWGAVAGFAEPYRKRPAFHLYDLVNRHLGDVVLASTVTAPGIDTGRWHRIPRASGTAEAFRLVGPPTPIKQQWDLSPGPGITCRQTPEGVLQVELAGDKAIDFYHAAISLPAKPGTGYKVTAEIRNGPEARGVAGIQVGDGRGWGATKSAEPSNGVRSPEWSLATVYYNTLPDATSLVILARRRSQPYGTAFELRNLVVQEYAPANLGATPMVACLASRDSASGAQLLVLINRSLDRTVEVSIPAAAPGAASAETLSGPAPESNNEKDVGTVTMRPLPLTAAAGAVTAQLPPCSVTGIRLPAATKR